MKKRNADRKNLVLYLDILPDRGDEPLCKCINISLTGIMMVTRNDVELDLDKKLRVRLKLPVTGDFNGGHLPLTLNLKWKRKDANPEYVCYGGEFVSLPKKTKDMVEKLSHYFAFSNNKNISELVDLSDYVIDVDDE